MKKIIPFSKQTFTGKEIIYLKDIAKNDWGLSKPTYIKLCEKLIETQIKSKKIFLTPSCTAALELSALLIDIKKGDEVIMPSFTFTSTANAFILRGATPVFVDISRDTLNISPNEIKKAITKKTKAIVPVHYAGISCDMDAIMPLKDKNIFIVEDAAQGYKSAYKKKYVGTIGDIGTFSFHETKNISSGEGGAISINNPKLIERAEIIREKGTNRSKFLLGLTDKYTWCDIGTSCLTSEISAAFLLAQIENSQKITENRLMTWSYYHKALCQAEEDGIIIRPTVPNFASPNAHIYYILLKDKKTRDSCIAHMRTNKIITPFHYIPLHSSPAGKKYSKYIGNMKNTDELSSRLLRLPLWYGLEKENQKKIVDSLINFLYKKV